jgi:Taurine catabolism dioxygenase TauD, TfdA family
MHVPTGPIESPTVWDGSALQTSDDWIYELSASERDEVRDTTRLLAARSARLGDIDATTFALPALAPALRAMRRELHRGRGFVLLRGVPVEDFTANDLARVYWLLGRHLGEPVAQNAAGELMCHVRDTGADPTSRDTRLYTTRAEQDFHTDGADIIGLLCVKPARSGGVSRIVSSARVFNEIQRRRPDLVPLLFANWQWNMPNARAEGAPPYFEYPICRFDGQSLSTFFIAWYIRNAQALDGVKRLSPEQEEVLRLVESIANDPSLYLDMSFQPGDIQWLKNSVILHKRTKYEDWPEPERKRHLLRLWLAARDFTDGDDTLRYGFAELRAQRDRR